MESTLDDLLERTQMRKSTQKKEEVQPQRSPLDVIRQMIEDVLAPTIAQVNERYQGKNVSVGMDASEFLSGRGRGLTITIQFGEHNARLEGTVLPEAIAFHETRHIRSRGAMVSGGPMLRTNQLTASAFADFLYERIIALVREVNRLARPER